VTTVTLADGSTAEVEMNDAIVVHGVDEHGAYLGLVSQTEEFVAQVVCPPPSPEGWLWSFDAERWVKVIVLADVVADAYGEIDAAAGAARSRYITVAPGQEAVYLRKAEQARAFAAAGFTGTAPPYIAAEAEARGMTAEDLANEVLGVAQQWDDVLSPRIEAIRMSSKRSIEAAATVEAAQALCATAVQQLNEI